MVFDPPHWNNAMKWNVFTMKRRQNNDSTYTFKLFAFHYICTETVNLIWEIKSAFPFIDRSVLFNIFSSAIHIPSDTF